MASRKKMTKATKVPDFKKLILQGEKSPIPITVAPMLCTLTRTPIDDPEYLYEIKWDGYRIVSYVQRKKVRMDSRSALDYTVRYPLIVKALQDLGHDVILDGEVVVFNEQGVPDFDALQLYNGHTSLFYTPPNVFKFHHASVAFHINAAISVIEKLVFGSVRSIETCRYFAFNTARGFLIVVKHNFGVFFLLSKFPLPYFARTLLRAARPCKLARSYHCNDLPGQIQQRRISLQIKLLQRTTCDLALYTCKRFLQLPIPPTPILLPLACTCCQGQPIRGDALCWACRSRHYCSQSLCSSQHWT